MESSKQLSRDSRLHLGRVEFHDSPPFVVPKSSPPPLPAAAWFARCFPQCFIVSRSARDVSATAFDRDVGDHADLPLGPLALSSIPDAPLAQWSCVHVKRSCCSSRWLDKGYSVLSLVTRDELGLSFSEPLELPRNGLHLKLRKFAPPMPPRRVRMTFWSFHFPSML